jgi:ATP-dependent Clp protease ATP-binding subunit ClpC
MFERVTNRAKNALGLAQDEAKAMGHGFIGTEHVLLGLLREGEGVAGRALRALGIELEATRADIAEIVGRGPRLVGDAQALRSIGIDLDEVLRAAADSFGADRVDNVLRDTSCKDSDRPRFVPRAKKVLELSLREAVRLGHKYIGTEHILLGIVREGQGVAAQILVTRTAGLDAVRDAVLETMSLPH